MGGRFGSRSARLPSRVCSSPSPRGTREGKGGGDERGTVPNLGSENHSALAASMRSQQRRARALGQRGGRAAGQERGRGRGLKTDKKAKKGGVFVFRMRRGGGVASKERLSVSPRFRRARQGATQGGTAGRKAKTVFYVVGDRTRGPPHRSRARVRPRAAARVLAVPNLPVLPGRQGEKGPHAPEDRPLDATSNPRPRLRCLYPPPRRRHVNRR